ncbi:growth arrest and DNA damage-inducible proteins-interacting protein CRIF [Cochliomyia hominivorax]
MLNLIVRGNNSKIIVLSQRKLSNIEVNRNEQSSDNVINCNKSGLLRQHQNILHNKNPYSEPNSWIHLTEKYQRKVFGRYGSNSGVDARICFSQKTEKSKSAFLLSDETEALKSMINKYRMEQKFKIDEVLKREEDICRKLEKLEQWKQELNQKILKKEADALAAKEKKERLIEEVRRHFGYKVDPRDERFKEVLEQKEREDKKKQKEEKRKAKEQKLMSKLVANTSNS